MSNSARRTIHRAAGRVVDAAAGQMTDRVRKSTAAVAAIGSIAGHDDSLWLGQMAAARGALWCGISGKTLPSAGS